MTQSAEDPRPDRPPGDADAPEAAADGYRLPQHVVTGTRMGAIWAAAIGFAIVLLLMLIFILQNSQRVQVDFYGAHAHLPLGVALLLAAVFGILLVMIPGIGRMVQLRLTARRHRRADAAATVASRAQDRRTDLDPPS